MTNRGESTGQGEEQAWGVSPVQGRRASHNERQVRCAIEHIPQCTRETASNSSHRAIRHRATRLWLMEITRGKLAKRDRFHMMLGLKDLFPSDGIKGSKNSATPMGPQKNPRTEHGDQRGIGIRRPFPLLAISGTVRRPLADRHKPIAGPDNCIDMLPLFADQLLCPFHTVWRAGSQAMQANSDENAVAVRHVNQRVNWFHMGNIGPGFCIL